MIAFLKYRSISAGEYFVPPRQSLHPLGRHFPLIKEYIQQGSALLSVGHAGIALPFPPSLWREPLWLGLGGGSLWLYTIPASISMLLV